MKRYAPTHEWGFGTHQDFKLKNATPYDPYDSKYEGMLAYKNNELFFGGVDRWLKVLVTAGQLPQNVRFVSPSFTEGSPFYSSITDANNGFTGTIVIYEGTYTVTDLPLTANIFAIGEVTINGTIYINTILDVSGSSLRLDDIVIGNTTTAYSSTFNILAANDVTIIRGGIFFNCVNIDNLNISGTITKVTFKGNIQGRLSEIGGSGVVNVTSDYIGNLTLAYKYTNYIHCNNCLDLSAGGSSINHLEIFNLTADVASAITLGDSSKTAFYHTTISSQVILNDECNVKFKNCLVTANTDNAVIAIQTMNQLVISNTTIKNSNASGHSISSTSNAPVLIYGESCSNVNWDNIDPKVSDLTVDTNIINEVVF